MNAVQALEYDNGQIHAYAINIIQFYDGFM